LTPFLEAARVHAIDRPDLYLDAPGQTFHGRDRFAPVAASLLSGAPIESLGPRVDDAVRLEHPAPARSGPGGGRIVGRVIHVDRYGNLVTDVPAEWLGGRLTPRARIGALEVRRVATHYAELERGVLALVVGSLGTLEVALRDDSAATATGCGRGALITLDLA
jgi:S-adenosylmethionine hydrolase